MSGYTFTKTTVNKIFVVRLKTGEDILDTLTEFVRKHHISGGSVNGIGALEKANLGFFDPKKKKYLSFEMGEVELTSCSGNIATFYGESMLHLHALVSTRTGDTKGGHIFSGCIVGPTAEFIIVKFENTLERTLDLSTGLNLLNLR